MAKFKTEIVITETLARTIVMDIEAENEEEAYDKMFELVKEMYYNEEIVLTREEDFCALDFNGVDVYF